MPSQRRGRLVFLHSEYFSPAQSGRRGGVHRKWQQPLSRDFIGEGRFGENFYSLLLVKLCEGGDEREGKGNFPILSLIPDPPRDLFLSVWIFGSGP